jgi:hypothetical protein
MTFFHSTQFAPILIFLLLRLLFNLIAHKIGDFLLVLQHNKRSEESYQVHNRIPFVLPFA